MDWQDLLAAFALYLILEGLIPFFSPSAFKQFLQRMEGFPDGSLRLVGFGSMIMGVILLNFVR